MFLYIAFQPFPGIENSLRLQLIIMVKLLVTIKNFHLNYYLTGLTA